MPRVEHVTAAEIQREIEEIAREELECTPEQALERLDRGELDDWPVGARLHMLRYLLEDSQPLAAE
jgi:hypothetical protein